MKIHCAHVLAALAAFALLPAATYAVPTAYSFSTGNTPFGNTALLRQLRPDEFTDERFGVPTVRDIIAELEKPGRDPRPEFRTATFVLVVVC